MLGIVYTNKMKRDVMLMKKRGKDITKLTATLSLLASGKPMPLKYRNHQYNTISNSKHRKDKLKMCGFLHFSIWIFYI